ncbi:hypothetical protein [Shimia sp. NS0008-38b]
MGMFKLLRGALVGVAVMLAHPVVAEDDFGFSDQQTKRTVDTFTYGVEQCATVDVVFRIDCLRQTYSQTVRVISKASVYWEAEVALTRVNRGLYSYVRANTDDNISRVRVNGGRIKALTDASIPQATALYFDAVDKAAAVMRGGSPSETRYFEPIAEAILASKALLQ